MLSNTHPIYYPNIYLFIIRFFFVKTNLIRKTLFLAENMNNKKTIFKKALTIKHDDDINLVECFLTHKANDFFLSVIFLSIRYRISNVKDISSTAQYNKCRFTLYPLICLHFIKIKIGFYMFVVFRF